MRTFLLISNGLICLLFLGVFAYTFYARQHLEDLARSYVTARTEKFAAEYIDPIVEVLEQGLQSAVAQKFLDEEEKAALAQEITEFRTRPGVDIRRLIAEEAPATPGSFRSRGSAAFFQWKEKIRAYYQQVLGRLLRDLRIFSGANFVAAGAAFWMVWRSSGKPSRRLQIYSLALLVSVVVAVYGYVDQLSFYTVLVDGYLGWWYPALLFLLFGYLRPHDEPRTAGLLKFSEAPAGLNIRPATPADHEAVWNIFRAVIAPGDAFVFDPQMSREDALEYWFRSDTRSYVAEMNEEVVGSYYLKPNQPGLGAHVANAGFMVAPEARGKGIGRYLAGHCLTEAKRLGYRAMQFNFVISTNETAVRLWQQLGFRIIGTLPGAFRHSQRGFIDAYVMFRELDNVA